MKRVLEFRSKAMLVLPFVSIVTEKVKFLKKVLCNVLPPVKVVGVHGGSGSTESWQSANIVICTIEKARCQSSF